MSETAGTPPERRLRDGLRTCLWMFLGLRIGLWVLAAVGVGVIDPRAGIPVPGWTADAITPGWHNLVTALTREDALWFLRIATSGYRVGDGSAAFFPLYPLLVRVVTAIVGGHPLLASLVVSNGAFLLALVVLYDLTARELSERVARTTIVYVAVFPTSFFFLAPYSESTFLLLSVATFWFARRDRWALAALAGVLAALTRSIGIVLAPALVVMAFERSRRGGGSLWGRVAAGASVLLGPLAYLAWWAVARGDALAPLDAQASWQRELSFPLTTLARAIRLAADVGIVNQGYWIIDVLVTGVVVVAVVAGWRRLPVGYLVYSLGSLLLPLSYPFPDRPLLSMPRFVAVLFPAFWVMADASERGRLPHTAVVATFAAGLGLLAVLFMNWWYIF